MNVNQKFMDFRDKVTHLTRGSRAPLLAVRLISLVVMVTLLTIHLRSLRVFRWELSVTAGIIITYFVASVGLTLCAGISYCGGPAFQAYLCGTGSALLAVNAAAIWWRWKRAGDLTRIVAELLASLGVNLPRQVRIKVFLSLVASISFLIDLIIAPLLTPPTEDKGKKVTDNFIS